MGKYDHFWEMREGGPYDDGREVYKCTDCGAVTQPDAGWNGAPDPSLCREGCKSRRTDWRPGGVSDAYRHNYDRIFRKEGLCSTENCM